MAPINHRALPLRASQALSLWYRQTTMSEELPREEGLPEESEESERWISDLFSARTDEATPREDTLRVCATCRRSLDKLNFSRTQWNKKQVGVSRCWECVSSDLEARDPALLCYPEAAERRPGQRTAAQRHNEEVRKVPCCYVFLCGLLECLECACFFCWLTS